MNSDDRFRLGQMIFGRERFKKATVAAMTIEPYIDMPFGQAWSGAVIAAFGYLDRKRDTPLWFWR